MGEDKTFFDELNEYAWEYPFTKKIENMTGIPAILQVFLLISYLIHQAWTGAYAQLIATCIGTLYPALRSITALQSKENDDDDKLWLTYWCVYGAITAADQLILHWILERLPFYYFGKLFFFLWLQLPVPIMGARVVYDYIFTPLYKLFGKELRDFGDRSSEALYDFDSMVEKGLSEMKTQAEATAADVITKQLIEKAQRE